ncbi:MAG: rod shape-determining protein MreC [Candidatus Dojkabacteria bacterium]|jgi:cell shape-determining protein MreC|nr:rod shape-determining protein MreC [Candidatus Dojkabacteria bacterium]
MKEGGEKKNYNQFVFLTISVLLLLLGLTSFGNILKYPFSYIFDPIHIFASDKGRSVSNWGEALLDASSYIEEYNSMKEEIARLKGDSTERILDYEEYKSLKEHISLISSEETYIESRVIYFTDTGEILINKGSDEGLKEGDVVTFGKIFIGTLSQVDRNSSLVRLPTNNSSTYEVVIVPGSIDLKKEFRVDSFVKSSGVVLGNLESMEIENMGINSNVSDGDTVLIRDERIGDILILGTLVGVSKNPASTHKNGFVSPIFDYSNILTVFVRKD